MAIHLNAARVNARMTQEEVAKRLKVSKNTIANYESYKKTPTVQRAKELAKLFNMSVDEIIWSKP